MESEGRSSGGFEVPVKGFTVRVPTWKVTGVLLVNQVPEGPDYFGFSGREAATNGHEFSWSMGRWEQRARMTTHARLSMSLAGWHLQTDLNQLPVPWETAQRYRHRVAIVDRPFFGQPEGTKKERMVHPALSSDVTRPGSKIRLQWSSQAKGLEALKEPKLAAFLQQAPVTADETTGWTPVPIESKEQGRAALVMPASLRPGNAWLRIGLTETEARPTERLLAEIRNRVSPLWTRSDEIAARFVPLVLNGDAGEQPGMVSTFFRRVAKHFANEVAVVTPNGKLLSHDLDKGWKKWREIPTEERRSLDDLFHGGRETRVR